MGFDVARNLDRPQKIKKLDPRLANFLHVQIGFWTTEILETSKNRIEIYVDPKKIVERNWERHSFFGIDSTLTKRLHSTSYIPQLSSS